MAPSLLQRAGIRELADLAELHTNRAFEMRVRERASFFDREEGSAERRVADVAAGQSEALREAREVEAAGDGHLRRDQCPPQLLAHFLVGERERDAVGEAALECAVDRVAEVRRQDRDAFERVESLQ